MALHYPDILLAGVVIDVVSDIAGTIIGPFPCS
jgi:hypothetical protein